MSNELKKIIVDGVEYTLPEGGSGGSSKNITYLSISSTIASILEVLSTQTTYTMREATEEEISFFGGLIQQGKDTDNLSYLAFDVTGGENFQILLKPNALTPVSIKYDALLGEDGVSALIRISFVKTDESSYMTFGVSVINGSSGGSLGSSDIVKIPITMTSSTDGTGTITDEDLIKIQNGSAVILTIPGMSVVITDLITSDGIGYYGGAQISLGESTDINGEPVLQARNVILAINGETKTCTAGIEYLNLLKIPDSGSSGSSQVFVDVNELPESPSDEVIYRLLKVEGIYNGVVQTNTTVHIVDTLPETGDVCTTDGSSFTVMYFNKSDNVVYGYVNATMGSAFGVPAGWYDAGALLGIANMTYGGVVDSIDKVVQKSTYYFVVSYSYYVYKTEWICLNPIGWVGSGTSSTKFNSYFNEASGTNSHAEGYYTTASGSHSHAEGYDTTASGSESHAEGYYTTASGSESHAEGTGTKASGSHSHAEGYDTTASGYSSHAEGSQSHAEGNHSHAEGYYTTASIDFSHAEGYYTTASGTSSHAEGTGTKASGSSQHAQGVYNIEDTENKYAHIVGNGGSDSARSNAHTLDWQGNAWFKGNIRVGGTSWDDATPVGGGSSGSENVFEDVTVLPENPDTQKIYRVSEPKLYMYSEGVGLLNFAGIVESQFSGSLIIENVNSLPENPDRVINTETLVVHLYILNNNVYGYNALGDNQWLSNTALLNATEMGLGYGGVITNGTSFIDGYYYLSYSEPKYVNINNIGTYRFVRDYELLATASLEVTDTSLTFINFADVTIVKNGGDLKQDLKAVIKIKPAGPNSDGFSTDITCDVELNSLINSRTSNLNMWSKSGSTYLGLNVDHVHIILMSLSGTTSMDSGIGFQLHLMDSDFKDTNIGVGIYTVEIYGR